MCSLPARLAIFLATFLRFDFLTCLLHALPAVLLGVVLRLLLAPSILIELCSFLLAQEYGCAQMRVGPANAIGLCRYK